MGFFVLLLVIIGVIVIICVSGGGHNSCSNRDGYIRDYDEDYEDYETKTYTIEEYGETVTKTVKIPNIKIGTGNAYVQDLVFVDEETRNILIEHINNLDIHTTLAEKLFWNNKINVDDAEEQITGELDEETLVLNRN